MIYPDYLEIEVIKYCELANIPIKNGNIPSIFVTEVQKFINVKMKSDRFKTRAIEEANKLRLNPIIEAQIKQTVESPIEEFMLTALVQNGLDKHCRPQFQIGTKRVDFAFPIAKLVVECDGRQYHFTDGELMEKDQKRDQYLAKKGWVVKHFDGLAIRRNIRNCMDEIQQYLEPFLLISQVK